LVIEERSLYVDMDPAIGTRTLPLAQVLGNFQMGCCGPEPREIEQGAVFSSKNEEHRKYLVISEKMMGTSSTTVRIFRFRL